MRPRGYYRGRRGRRSSGNGQAALILAVVVLAVAVLFGVIVPPLLPLLWLYFELRDRDLAIPTSLRAFALSRAEWIELEQARSDLAAAADARNKTKRRLAEAVEEIELRPLERWKSWVDAMENVWGNRIGLASGFVCFVVVLLTRLTPMNEVYAGMRSDMFGSCGKLVDKASFVSLTLIVLPLLSWLIGALVGWSMGKNKAVQIVPEPGPAVEAPTGETTIADDDAREQFFKPVGGAILGVIVAAIASVMSIVLLVAAVVGKV